ncbi:MAG TPA: nicotinate-nicotinamide nucleotide adenylyltransferase, partial [Spirochaetota bacterium]|nr:nicotinate-nicotinamide nucleotide adenylyltransferase [Spirochaetota bacterium]
SFTILTLKQLKALYPDEDLFFIIGSDSFNELDTWRDSEELLSLGRFIVLNRPGNTKLREDILQRGTFHIYHNPLIEISSSDIRSKLKFGKSARYLLPDAVLEYILQKEFYKN